MLPSVSPAKPAVEWLSACPLAAAVSAGGATASVIMEFFKALNASRHCSQSEAAYSPSPAAHLALFCDGGMRKRIYFNSAAFQHRTFRAAPILVLLFRS